MGLKRAMMIGLDGADPLVVKRLIKEGRLPNLKRVLENGVANDSLWMIGAFPSVTPPNWCSLATGNWPRTHGVTCFMNQTLGDELDNCQLNWDSRRVESDFIWEAFSREGKRSIMLNYCEAWPPRMNEGEDMGIYIDGTGVEPFIRCELDAPQLVVLKDDCELQVIPHITKTSASDCIVSTEMLDNMMQNDEAVPEEAVEEVAKEYDAFVETPFVEFPFPVLTPHVLENQGGPGHDDVDRVISPFKEPTGFSFDLPENAKVAVVPLCKSTIRRLFVMTASDGVHYDTITIYKNKKDSTPLGVITTNGWSEAIHDVYVKDNEHVHVGYYGRIMNLADDGSSVELLLSHAMDMTNLDYFYPRDMGSKLLEAVGPFRPHIRLSSYGPQYGKYELETWENIYKWHADATHWLFKEYPDWQLFYVHLHGIDIYNHWYINQTLPGWSGDQAEYYQEMLAKMYEYNDAYVGEILKYLDDDTNIIITSDHAAVPNSPGDENPGIGVLSGIGTKVMEDLGYTKLVEGTEGTMNPKIDWSKTTAISARLAHIYINLKGRDPQGIVEPEDYQKTVEQIIADLYSYRHPETGKRVVAFCMTRDEMEMVGMGGPHCGDIFMQLMPTYCETHGNCPSTVEHEDYSLNNLCMMIGADFKKGEKIRRVIRITDVVPTLCHLVGNAVPTNCEGGVIWQALEGFEEEPARRKMEKVNRQSSRYTRAGE